MNYFLCQDMLAASIPCDGDHYDTLGRNLSAQQRRQTLIPWTLVDRSYKKYNKSQKN